MTAQFLLSTNASIEKIHRLISCERKGLLGLWLWLLTHCCCSICVRATNNTTMATDIISVIWSNGMPRLNSLILLIRILISIVDVVKLRNYCVLVQCKSIFFGE